MRVVVCGRGRSGAARCVAKNLETTANRALERTGAERSRERVRRVPDTPVAPRARTRGVHLHASLRNQNGKCKNFLRLWPDLYPGYSRGSAEPDGSQRRGERGAEP